MKLKRGYHICLPGKASPYDTKENNVRCIGCSKSLPVPKRTRHVFRSYDECAHVWASQKLGYGNAYKLYFEGPSIWSYGYHFEIARFISPDVVLFTTRGYSNTTSHHKWAVHAALSHKTLYEVPDFNDHDKNAEYFIELITNQVSEIKRGRAGLIMRIRALGRDQRTAARYLAAFKNQVSAPLRCKLWALIKKEFFTKADLKAFRVKEARHEASQGRAQETRRRNDDIRRANWGREFDVNRAHLNALLVETENVWGDAITDMTRAAWSAGEERARLPQGTPIMLRIVGEEIETSQGAFVPVIEARKLWHVLRKDAAKAIGMRIGHYTVDRIKDKNLIVGCHTIPMREVARMAVKLGLEKGDK